MANDRIKVKIRKARNTDINEVCEVLSESFQPYRHHYTEEAYEETAISALEIGKRIPDKEKDVLAAVCSGKIVGTASIEVMENASLRIRSMAVRPSYQGRGIGWCILQRIDEVAKQRNCKIISLEGFEPLTKAADLYSAFGFMRTGKTRKYHGIVVFEMTKYV